MAEKHLTSDVAFFKSNMYMFLNFHFSELSVFANNSTKAGVIVETMSAPNPVRFFFFNIRDPKYTKT